MSIHAFIVLTGLVVTWNILNHDSPTIGGTVLTSQRWAIITGNLRLIWSCVFVFEAYKFVRWFLAVPDHQIVFVAGAFFVTRRILKSFGRLSSRPALSEIQAKQKGSDPALNARIREAATKPLFSTPLGPISATGGPQLQLDFASKAPTEVRASQAPVTSSGTSKVADARIFIYWWATIFWWSSLVFAVYRFVH